MKKLLLPLLIFLPVILLSCSDKKRLVVGTNDRTPPFAYLGGETGGEIIGFDIEFANMIAKELGRELVIETMRFDELIPSVLDEKVNMSIAAIFITEERKKIVNMSRPYYEVFQVILVRKDNSSFDNVSDINEIAQKDKKLSSQLNTVGMTAAASIAGDNPVVGYKSIDRAVDELLNRNVDAVVVDKMTANRFIAENKELVILPKIQFFERYYGVAINKKDNKLLAEVNNAIARSITTGEYMEWVQKYMSDGY